MWLEERYFVVWSESLSRFGKKFCGLGNQSFCIAVQKVLINETFLQTDANS